MLSLKEYSETINTFINMNYEVSYLCDRRMEIEKIKS